MLSSNDGGTNSTDSGGGGHGHGGHDCASCDAAICVILGIVIHVVGSIGINLGQNLQALSFNLVSQIGEDGKKSFCNKKTMWSFGMALFAVSSIVTFAALALASASILVPLESVQFIVNIIFSKVVRGKTITYRMITGVASIMAGIALFVLFGPNEGVCFDEDTLMSFWTQPAWWIYCAITFSIAAAAYIVWRRYEAAPKEAPLWRADIVEPVAYTISSALFGGGQMIVHTKLLAELIELNLGNGDFGRLFAGPNAWFFWLELFLTLLFGGYWLVRLSQCLMHYEALFIIPLMQTAFIIFGAVAGGIYFQEFSLMSEHPWVGAGAYGVYGVGLLLSLGGLCLLASSVAPDDASAPSSPSPPRAKTEPSADQPSAEPALAAEQMESLDPEGGGSTAVRGRGGGGGANAGQPAVAAQRVKTNVELWGPVSDEQSQL